MSRKIALLLILIALLSQFTTSISFTAHESGSNCPPGFTLEPAMHHDDHHHQHVGTSADQNGDGSICVKPVAPGETIHVHVDNNLP
jgi:hypothetical protein